MKLICKYELCIFPQFMQSYESFANLGNQILDTIEVIQEDSCTSQSLLPPSVLPIWLLPNLLNVALLNPFQLV